MIALRVYKNHETHKIIGYRIVDESTLQYVDIDTKTLKKLYRHNECSVTNLEMTNDGQLRFINMNPNVRQKWFSRTMDGDITIENFCIVINATKELIKFMAINDNGEVIQIESSTLNSIVSALRVPIDKMKFYNAYISYDEIGKTVLNVFNRATNDYVAITSRRMNLSNEKGILGENWEAKIIDANIKGLHVLTLRNIKGEPYETLPEQIYRLERFKGGVNNLIITSSVNQLGKGCFKELKDLYSVKIENGLKEIPEECFLMSGLETIKLPSSVQVIRDGAFYKCIKLTGPLVTTAIYIGSHAFDYTKVSIVNVSEAIEIKDYAFSNNKRLRIVKLGEGLRHIGKFAFYNNPLLESVVIPSTVESIDDYAFDMCPKLSKIQIKMGGHIRISKKCFKSSVKVEYIQ